MSEITSANKIKKTIMLGIDGLYDKKMDTNEQIEQIWTDPTNLNILAEAAEEFRGSGLDTKLSCADSNNYDSRAVAAEMFDGTWVGWTFWFGGGKHGEPSMIPWLEHAYPVTFTEQKQTIVVRKFRKV